MLNAGLRRADTIVREYVKGLKAENAKLQRQVVKLECEAVSATNRIASLEREVHKLVTKGHVTVVISDPTRNARST